MISALDPVEGVAFFVEYPNFRMQKNFQRTDQPVLPLMLGSDGNAIHLALMRLDKGSVFATPAAASGPARVAHLKVDLMLVDAESEVAVAPDFNPLYLG